MIKTFLVNDYFDELQHATAAFNWMLAVKKGILNTTNNFKMSTKPSQSRQGLEFKNNL